MKVPGTLDATLANLNNTVNKAFVYAKLFDEKVKVSVGKGTDETWGLFYSNYATTTGFDGKDGVKIEVMPIEGLSVGAHYGTGNLFGKAFKDGFVDAQESDRRLVVGAKYVSDFFSVVATTAHNFVEVDKGVNAYKGDEDWGYDTQNMKIIAYEALNNIDAPIANTSNLLVGVKVNPFEALQIDLSVAAVNLGSWTIKKAYGNPEKDDGDITGIYKKGDFNPYWGVFPKLKAEYAVNDQLSASLVLKDIQFADQVYTKEGGADDPEDSGLGLFFPITINPAVAYAINDDISVGLDLNFKINAEGSDQFGIGFMPSATFNLGSGATFVVYNDLTFYTKSKEIKDSDKKTTDYGKAHPLIGNVGPLSGASGTVNVLQFDFVWTF
jgi:hypothetical protein